MIRSPPISDPLQADIVLYKEIRCSIPLGEQDKYRPDA